MITKITDAYTRHYSDNGQTVTYVEWIDEKGESGRTEGATTNPHMAVLLQRAGREGKLHRTENW